MSESKLIKLLNNDPNFFYYNGNNSGGTGNFTQKKIKYGEDRPGSSNSGQPYIVTAIPNRSSFARSVDDGFIRGGATTADRASIIDKERISRFLKDKPKGPLFIQRQIGLQFSNPKLEVKKYPSGGEGLVGGALSLAASTFNVINELVPGPTRLYNNGFNTLAQIGANAFGQHFNRHGLSPVQDDNSKYLAVAKFNNENGNNRLVGLKNKLLKENSLDNILSNRFLNSVNFVVGNINALLGTRISTVGLQAPELTIDNYQGGPGSVYGRGRTLIRRFDITNGGTNKYSPIDSVDTSRIQTLSRLYSSAPDPAITQAISLFVGLPRPIDKIRVDAPSVQTAIPYTSNIPAGANPYRSSTSPTARLYSDIKSAVEKLRTNASVVSIEHDQKELKSTKYAYYGKKKVFNSNSIAIYSNTTQFERADANILTADFYVINPFNQVEDLIKFSAYMKGFKNNFDATWSEYNYVGRSESFYTYGKFKSSVSFTLDIPCFNKEQLLEKHRALGQLAATTAGAYNDNNQLLSGVLLKVKIGKYLDNEYAILDNISYDIPDDSSWDIDEKLAMYLKVNISLTIIYKNLPQYKKNEGFFKQLRDTNPSFLNPNYKTVLASTNPNSNNTTPNSNNTTPNPIDPTLLRDLINPLNRN
jgi:hypothetical protein